MERHDHNDPYRELVCAVLRLGQQDAVNRGLEWDRAWLYSRDCMALCQMVDLDHSAFKMVALKKIENNDRKKPSKNLKKKLPQK